MSTAYAGSELEIFLHATNWKHYYGRLIRPFLGNRVLEVGAGIGGTTSILSAGPHSRWLCLERDPALAERIQELVVLGKLPRWCEVRAGTTADLRGAGQFDSVVYIDVLEHIEDDRGEIARAVALLAPGGHLVILAPAHQRLYTPFDRAIGHYRRYNRRVLHSLMPPVLERILSRYLDSAGVLALLANRLFLRSGHPSHEQIQFWDKALVPLSRIVDPLLGYAVGKSILEVRRLRPDTT